MSPARDRQVPVPQIRIKVVSAHPDEYFSVTAVPRPGDTIRTAARASMRVTSVHHDLANSMVTVFAQ